VGDGSARDPGSEQVVGVLGQVVADQDVEQIGVAAQMRIGQGDQLTLAGRDRERHRPVQRAVVSGDECCGDEERGRVRGRGQGQYLLDGAGVAADETVEEEGLVGGHAKTVARGADDALTAG
jgi:hypothetical protein